MEGESGEREAEVMVRGEGEGPTGARRFTVGDNRGCDTGDHTHAPPTDTVSLALQPT